MSEEPTQRCPACALELGEHCYTPSTWGTKGEACRSCKRARQVKWMAEHPEQSRARYRKYKAKQPIGYERRRKLKSEYGITPEQFDKMYERQGGRCFGCLRIVPKTGGPGVSICVDHDHVTNKVRGLLCDPCNRALGSVRDDQSTLRRLMTYLQRDPEKSLVYLAGSLRNPRIREIGNLLRCEGWDVMDEWHTPGERADDSWQEYEQARGRNYKEALAGRGATNIFLFDKSYIDLCDALVVLMPAGKSAMLELGYASGMGKATYILLDGTEPERFEVMPNFATGIVSSVDELVAAMKTRGL